MFIKQHLPDATKVNEQDLYLYHCCLINWKYGISPGPWVSISLGLIGGGGSILTVPALVYLLQVNPVLATSYSLFVVGATSLAGSLSFMKKGMVDYKTAIVFATPSFIAVYLTRKYLVPAIPEVIAKVESFYLTRDIAIMIFFAVIMLIASVSMIRNNRKEKGKANATVQYNFSMIGLEGALVGTLTGIVGAGGGFLIIPALVLFAKLPMKMAVGTSLLIIAVKSLIGFLGDIGIQPIDWSFMLLFTALSLAGVFFGSWLSEKIHAMHLKRGFGWFVLAMAFYILFNEIYLYVE